jgi:hypothetical protein
MDKITHEMRITQWSSLILFTEIPKHQEDTNLIFMKGLLPWSKSLPTEYRKLIVNKYHYAASNGGILSVC